MSLKNLLVKAALFFSFPLTVAPAAFAQDHAWADFNPSTGSVNAGMVFQGQGGSVMYQPGSNIAPEPYFYPQGPQMPNPGMAGMGGMSGMLGGMGGQQQSRYPKQNLPPARYATMAVDIGAEANPNATYFGLGGGGAATPAAPPAPPTRPISIDEGIDATFNAGA